MGRGWRYIWSWLQEAGKCPVSFLLSAEDDGKQPQNLSRGCAPSFVMFGEGRFHILPTFPPPSLCCYLNKFIFTSLPLKRGVFMHKPCLVYLSRLKWRLKCLSALSLGVCFTRMIPSCFPLFFHFAQKVSFSSPMPRCCPGKVRTLPVSPRGQRAPSHMPCRLARSSVPLNWLIATQEKKKKNLPHCCHSTICCLMCKHETHERHTRSPFHILIEPRAPMLQMQSLVSLPSVNLFFFFAFEIKQIHFLLHIQRSRLCG